MALLKKIKNQIGFTMAEVLVVVAIIAILGGIVTVQVINSQKKLEQFELDQTAELIALSVENNLTNLKAAGLLDKDHIGQTVTIDETSNLATFNSATYSGPLVDSTLGVISGTYEVTFNIKTGTVTRVEYTKREGKVGIYTNEVQGIPVDFASTEFTLFPIAEVENQNEVTLNIYLGDRTNDATDYLQKLQGFSNYSGGFTYEVTLAYGTDKISVDTTGYSTSICDATSNYIYECQIPVSKEVAEIKKAGYVGNIKCTVYAKYSGGVGDGNAVYLTDAAATENIAIFHDLFGNGTVSNTIDISCRRHMDNLSYLDLNKYKFDSNAPIEVLQSANIDLSLRYNDYDSSGTYGLVSSYFSPIENIALFGNESYSGKAFYNGNSYEIVNMTIRPNTGDSDSGYSKVNNSHCYGLFAYTNCDIQDVVLINPTVDARFDSGSISGALVGHTFGGTISKCKAYLVDKADFASSTEKVDINEDLAEASVTDDKGRLTANIFGQKYAGGLIGYADGSGTDGKKLLIAGNLAAVNVGSDTRSGGFVGVVKNCEIGDNYSSGMVHITPANLGEALAGGFVGAVEENVSIYNCISFGNVYVPYMTIHYVNLPDNIQEALKSEAKYNALTNDEKDIAYIIKNTEETIPQDFKSIIYANKTYDACLMGYNFKAYAGGFSGSKNDSSSFYGCLAYGCSETYIRKFVHDVTSVTADIITKINELTPKEFFDEICGVQDYNLCGGFVPPPPKFPDDHNTIIKECAYANQNYSYKDVGAAKRDPAGMTKSDSAPSADVFAYGQVCKEQSRYFDFWFTSCNIGGTTIVLPHYGDWPLIS